VHPSSSVLFDSLGYIRFQTFRAGYQYLMTLLLFFETDWMTDGTLRWLHEGSIHNKPVLEAEEMYSFLSFSQWLYTPVEPWQNGSLTESINRSWIATKLKRNKQINRPVEQLICVGSSENNTWTELCHDRRGGRPSEAWWSGNLGSYTRSFVPTARFGYFSSPRASATQKQNILVLASVDRVAEIK
jgi:hypothetical protein